MGRDQPVHVQVWNFFYNAATGDLGIDVRPKRPVVELILELILEVFPNRLVLGVVALGWAMQSGIGLGCLAVVYRGSILDRALGIISVGMTLVPSFVIALYGLLIFSVWLGWLPAIGAGEKDDFRSQVSAVLLPTFSIGITWVGYPARLVPASMLEAMGANHFRTARAFGLPERKVVFRSALGVAIIPTIAVLAVGSRRRCKSGTVWWRWARCCS